MKNLFEYKFKYGVTIYFRTAFEYFSKKSERGTNFSPTMSMAPQALQIRWLPLPAVQKQPVSYFANISVLFFQEGHF